MWNPFRRRTPPAAATPAVLRDTSLRDTSLRDTLFGDLPLASWPPNASEGPRTEPWKSFVAARNAVADGRVSDAVQLWTHVIGLPHLESCHYAQAWHFLRTVGGVSPPAERAKELLGVVMEVPIGGGVDFLAAYPDRTARYINHSGASIYWDHPDGSLDAFSTAFLTAGERVVEVIGIWEGAGPAAPPPGSIRVSFILPAGLAFGQGPFEVLANDPLAASVVTAGTMLMQQLIARTGRPGT